jgi:hypothetical protein
MSLTFLIEPISAIADILFEFALIPCSVMTYPRSFPPGDSKGSFFWVQLDVESPKVVDGFFQIRDEFVALY